MLYLKTISNVTQNETNAVGLRAQDLALLQQNKLSTPNSFVILSTAFDEMVRTNSLKYKIDYILSHAQVLVQQSLVNAYNGIRKATLEATLPPGLETELRDMFQSITSPLSIGELVATNEQNPARIILSMNLTDDPENNDTIIQNVGSFAELLVGIREAWALAYHPSQLGARLREKFPENKLKVALIVQSMEEPKASTHAYSCLPQDHHKVYLQTYTGYPDLREKISKDYYAVSKENLRIVAAQAKPQTSFLNRNEAKELVVVPFAEKSELIERDLLEIARLTKKAERILKTPVKAFFCSDADAHDLLWVNRLGFDIMIKDEAEQAASAPTPTPAPILEPAAAQVFSPSIEVVEEPKPDDFIAEQPSAPMNVAEGGVAAKLLHASLQIVRQVVERKYRSAFGETAVAENVAEMINRLNQASTFSRSVDGALLLQAEEAAKNESNISESEYAKTIGEVAFLMTYV